MNKYLIFLFAFIAFSSHSVELTGGQGNGGATKIYTWEDKAGKHFSDHPPKNVKHTEQMVKQPSRSDPFYKPSGVTFKQPPNHTELPIPTAPSETGVISLPPLPPISLPKN